MGALCCCLRADQLDEYVNPNNTIFRPCLCLGCILNAEQMVEPAVNGTKNVIKVAAEAGVRGVVFTSSIGVVYMDPNRSPYVVVDEKCWSDLDFCKNTKNWYCYGKAVAEKAVWEVPREKGVDLVVIIPELYLLA